ncbi:MAG TPA: hypothetical protein VJS85_02160, partial [Rhizomicrobium sp.]|nr:hypothetical protein [Rhizomicrobium sp.]
MPPKGPSQAAPESALAVDTIDTREFARNMLTVGMKSQQLVLDFIARMSARENPGPVDPLNISGAMLALAKAMGGDREAVAAAQAEWWNNVMLLWETTARRMLGGEAPAVVEPAPGDRRFKAEEWRQNEIFDFIKQSYLLTANAMQEMVGKLNG